MYGLEDNSKKGFQFDLEIAIEKKAGYGKEILDKTETRMHELKKVLREGQKDSEFEKLGLLLQGYKSLSKVIGKMKNK